MERPKQQHFVPKVYLRHFCTEDNKNQIYFYDKVSKKAAATSINNIAQEKDFYADISMSDKDYYEKYYSDSVEPVLGKLLESIISKSILCNDKVPLLSNADRQTLSKMIVYQMLRTRGARNFIREKADKISKPFIEQVLELPAIQKRKELCETVEKYRILNEDVFKQISLPLAIDETRIARYVAIIDNMVCTFYDNRTKTCFVTGDNPIIIRRLATQSMGLGEAGLAYKDCIVAYPISPRLTAVLCHKCTLLSDAFREYENRRCPITQSEIIDTFNRWQFIYATRQIYSKEPIL